MKPLAFFIPLSRWALRLALCGYAFFTYLNSLLNIRWEQLSFYISLLWCTGAVMLVLGGMFQRQKLTVFSGILLSALVIFTMVQTFDGIHSLFIHQLLLLGASMLFVGSGNK